MVSIYPEPATLLQAPVSGWLYPTLGFRDHMMGSWRSFWQTTYPQGEWQILDGEHITANQLQQELCTPSLWQQERCFHLHTLHRADPILLEAILHYAQHPLPGQWLCLTGEPLDKRSKWGKQLYQRRWLHNLPQVTPSQSIQWLKQRAKAMGLTLLPTTLSLLVQLWADDLASLEQLLELLQLGWPDARPSQHEMVTWIQDSYGDLAQPDTFGWLQTWRQGPPGAFGPTLLQALGRGANPFALFFVAARSLRQCQQHLSQPCKAPPPSPHKYGSRAEQQKTNGSRQSLQQALLDLPLVERRLKQEPAIAPEILLTWLEQAQGYWQTEPTSRP